MDSIQEGANYADESEEEASSDTISDCWGYDYGLAADDSDEDCEGDGYELDYASLNANPELLRMLGASERVIAAKEAQVSAIVSTWEPPPEPGLENSTTIIADSAAVVLGSGKAPCGSGVARVSKPVGGFDQDAAAAAATAQGAPVWKVKIVHSPESVPRGRLSKLLPVPQDSSLSDDNDDEHDESWDEASANGHAWWESGSEDEEYEMMSAMSPNLQAVLGLRGPSGIDTANAEQDDNKNEWHPPSFAGLNNSRRVKVLKPLVVGHGKDFDAEYRNRGRQEEEEVEDGDGDDDSSEGEGWDYQDMSKDDYDSYVREWSTDVSPNLARAMGCPSSVEHKPKALSKQLSREAPASFGLRKSGYIKDVGRTNSSVPTDDTTADASRRTASSLKRSLTIEAKALSKGLSCETPASFGLRDSSSSGTIKDVRRTNSSLPTNDTVDASRPASSLKRSLVLRWRKAVDASCFGIGEHEQST